MSRGLLPSVAPRSTRASGDRWLFGYADVVTLLFACFAALYAAATAPVPVASAAAPAAPSPSIRVDLAAEFAQLRLRESELQIDVTRSPRGTVVSLAEAGSFAPGDAELSPAARATRVVQWLVEDGRIAPARLSAAGYAEYRPRVANTEPEGRARNRRVDIVVLDARAQDAPDAADYRTGGSPPSGGR